ncbi:uncharacterized protein LOC128731422 [Anopheles nili]|uniref:uncharacterized protein LOC128731422 n=1 Tax=Anopheles nili TaxID=185578 RepID=UPI00237AB7C4|nr:uncharacterized protein LOC128731422 [Anopheles nili]
MSSYKPIDLSKEDFRKYLDRKGVLDAMTKVLVKCNTDRPENAIQYVMEKLGESHGSIHTELHKAHQEIERLKNEISLLQIGDKQQKTADKPPEADTTQDVKINITPQSSPAQTNGDADGGAVVKEELEVLESITPSIKTEPADEVAPKDAQVSSANGVPETASAPNDEAPVKKENAADDSK